MDDQEVSVERSSMRDLKLWIALAAVVVVGLLATIGIPCWVWGVLGPVQFWQKIVMLTVIMFYECFVVPICIMLGITFLGTMAK